MLAALDTLASKAPEVVSFAIAHIATRLVTPWHLLFLATDTPDPAPAVQVAAGPRALAVVMVLDYIQDQVDVLRAALRKQRFRRAKETLMAIYDTEYAIRSRIDLAASAWEAQLQVIMQSVINALDTEEADLPTGLNHVLRSPALRNHHSLTGRAKRFARKCRDAIIGFASLRNSQA
jgi:hypothetical protein